MIKDLYNIWNIKSHNIHGEEFTGYEPVYDQLDKLDKPAFNKDPEATVDKVFDIYRSINIVPILYYTEKGLINAIKEFKSISYNSVKDSRISLGNNRSKKDIIDYPDTYPDDEPMRRCPNIRKANLQLNYSPRISLDEGIKRFLTWTNINYKGT